MSGPPDPSLQPFLSIFGVRIPMIPLFIHQHLLASCSITFFWSTGRRRSFLPKSRQATKKKKLSLKREPVFKMCVFLNELFVVTLVRWSPVVSVRRNTTDFEVVLTSLPFVASSVPQIHIESGPPASSPSVLDLNRSRLPASPRIPSRPRRPGDVAEVTGWRRAWVGNPLRSPHPTAVGKFASKPRGRVEWMVTGGHGHHVRHGQSWSDRMCRPCPNRDSMHAHLHQGSSGTAKRFPGTSQHASMAQASFNLTF